MKVEKKRKNKIFVNFFYDFAVATGAVPGLIWLRPKRIYENPAAKKHIQGGALIVNGSSTFTANNVIVYDDGGRTKETAGALSSYVNHQSYGIGKNVYIFTNYYVAQLKYEGSCHIDPIALNTSLSDASVKVDEFDSTIWDMTGTRAKFVSMP